MSDDATNRSWIPGRHTAALDNAGLKGAKRRRASHLIWLVHEFGIESHDFRQNLEPGDREIMELLATVPDHLWPQGDDSDAE